MCGTPEGNSQGKKSLACVVYHAPLLPSRPNNQGHEKNKTNVAMIPNGVNQWSSLFFPPKS